MSKSIARRLRALFTAAVWCAGAGTALAAAEPDSVSFTLEGCRNNGTITLPDGNGKFICPTAVYTSGNLGKGWNELDLVPYRLTASTGNSAPVNQTYALAVVVDSMDAGKPGFDVLSTLTLNAGLSSAGCVAAGSGPELLANPGIGGTQESRYRIITIPQIKNTTCVYDYYARLALGSHLFPGSSLHANLTNQNLGTAGIGARDVSIPVKEISPQELRKDMSATADSTVQWGLTKEADKSSLNFGNVCKAPDGPLSQQVTFTVKWTKIGTSPGGVTFVTHIYAKNPAARTITVNVTDKVYKGTTQAVLLDTLNSGNVNVPANTEALVLTHTGTLASSAGAVGDFLNDVATATYIDLVTGIPVPGNTTATASAQIVAGATFDSFAAIADTESITGTGLKFSVATPSIGAFLNGYVAGTQTVGPVDWGITGQTTSGQVQFVKTVYLDAHRVTTGTLTDTATLVASPPPNGFTTTAGPVSVGISSSAEVTLNLTKRIPPQIVLGAGQRIEVVLRVTRSSDAFQVDKTLTFGPGETFKTATLTGLLPDTYTVTEVSALYYASPAAVGVSANLQAQGSSQQTVILTAGADGIFSKEECEGTAAFVNIPAGGNATAKVKKITDPVLAANDPDIDWTFTLNGPGGPVPLVVKAGADFAEFPLVLQEGNYTVTETQKAPAWVLTNAAPDANNDKICEFAVDYPLDFGKVFSCTFYNQKQGKAKVIKTVQGLPPSGTQAFTFQLRKNASVSAIGTVLESGVANAGNLGLINFAAYLVPGNHYQLCEVVMPGWSTTLGTFVPGSFPPPDSIDNSILCVDFTVAAGETKTFNVDNSPPPGGRALTIGFWKNWTSCDAKGSQKPVLDQTLAAAETNGVVVSAATGSYPVFGPAYYLVLHGNAGAPNVAPDCQNAIRLLNKSTTDTGKKSASDPAFNMAAQLVAAELNYVAGAGKTPEATTAINQAVVLLGKYSFDGKTHTAISAADATLMNNLAKILDDYNNNR